MQIWSASPNDTWPETYKVSLEEWLDLWIGWADTGSCSSDNYIIIIIATNKRAGWTLILVLVLKFMTEYSVY